MQRGTESEGEQRGVEVQGSWVQRGQRVQEVPDS